MREALNAIGAENVLSSNPEVIKNADGLILPGVGAFPLAMQELKNRNLVDVLKDVVSSGTPLLGVCLGMQLLLEGSTEHEYTEGLGFIPGTCVEIPEKDNYPVPHMGWNGLNIKKETALVSNEQTDDYVYFVHSYWADCPKEYIDATADYSIEVTAMISKGNVYGAQFHPEKSSTVGLGILEKFKAVVDDANLSSN
jgi:glutamine amidotransferase